MTVFKPQPTDRRFNHDLLITESDQQAARQRWPTIAFLLHDPTLVERFQSYEDPAKRLKAQVQWIGTGAVVLTFVALIGAVLQVRLESGASAFGDRAARLFIIFDVCSILGLLFAVLASRFGNIRRRWLQHRFVTEILRQWHFRSLLDGRSWNLQSTGAREKLAKTRSNQLHTLMNELSGSLGQKMDRLVESGDDALGRIPEPQLTSDAIARRELIEAYRVLRLDHQIDFAVYKLSPDDRTFANLSSSALIWMTDQLAGTTLLLALALTVASLIRPITWASLGAVSLAIAGVAARAWRDGLSLGEDFERYQEMRHRLESLRARRESAPTDQARFEITKEVEQAALEELRSFIRSHGKAQFLF